MKKLITTFFALMAMLALVSPLYAGEYARSHKAGTAKLSAGELKGMKVVSQNGDKIGTIKSANIDERNGEIRFVTVSKDKAGSSGENDIAIPGEALRFDRQDDRATLTVNENKLNNVPQQSDMSNDEFQRNLERHYGVAPAWQGGAQETAPTVKPDKKDRFENPTAPSGLSKPGRYY